MNIVGIICARGGSKGVPRKNIKLLNGKPLIAYSIEAALKSSLINKVIVSTEDEEIRQVSLKFGAEVVHRPVELAADNTKTPPVMVHAVNELINEHNYTPDIVCLVQATSPLRDEKIIDAALNQLINSDNDSIFTGYKRGSNQALWLGKTKQGIKPLYDYHLRPRRQETELFEDLYTENGSFYAIKYDAFLKTQDVLGDKVDIYIVDQKLNPQVDVDTPEDFKKAEEILAKRSLTI